MANTWGGGALVGGTCEFSPGVKFPLTFETGLQEDATALLGTVDAGGHERGWRDNGSGEGRRAPRHIHLGQDLDWQKWGVQSMTMRWPYLITGTVFLLLAAFVAVESLNLRYYTTLGPGPGFFPFWLSVILAGLSIGMLLQAGFRRSEPMPADFFANVPGYLKMGAVVLGLIVTTALLEPVGYCLTMLAVYSFLLWALGRHNLIFMILVALFGSFGVYYIFVHWLQVPLPTGLLGL
jgi:putative tricarboxylic transport membrane protein